ncbi:MAG: Rieske (2Fe-2S) protein [Candidatus Eisenbacteria bacterium]|nr:Rieske (2Fe-2S) protein [Candidatus Eisenbacteria bacterium]
MTTRRRVLRDLAAGVAGLAIWPKAAGSQDAPPAAPADSTKSAASDTTAAPPEVSIALSAVRELAKVGGSAVVTVKGRTLLLARDSETSVLAFESRCTHKQVTLKFDHKNARLNCPAHGSRFDLGGKVQKGPAKEHLQAYPAVLKADTIVVTLPE